MNAQATKVTIPEQSDPSSDNNLRIACHKAIDGADWLMLDKAVRILKLRKSLDDALWGYVDLLKRRQ